MKNKIYVHTSNLEFTRYLRDDPSFIPIYEYLPQEFEIVKPNEYGIIRTKVNDFHILIGRMQQEGCPWCGEKPDLKRYEHNDVLMPHFLYVKYWLECRKCGSRGPTICINKDYEYDVNNKDWTEHYIYYRYKTRLPCDYDLNKEKDQ